MSSKSSASEIDLLLFLLDQGYDKKAWHGPNLRGAIRRLSAAQAAWRPGPKRRSIAEIVVHAAYWKYAVRRRLRGDKRGSFPLKGSNWFSLPEPVTELDWC
ncbi:MAG TPA: DinB family protein, partial [Gemmataceae bacterium]|nr:DinB family protein [Gemmataceae bacterium]